MNAPSKVTRNVYQRLNEARAEFHSLELRKSGKFPGGRGNYFELADFIVPALRIFSDHGLAGIVSFVDDEARLDVVNVDAPTEAIRFSSPMGTASLKGCHEVQNIGAVQTYQRRYLWMMALEIVEHDALDASVGDAAEEKPVSVAASADVTKIIQLCEAVGGNQAAIICRAYDIEALPDLNPRQAKAVITRLEEKLAEKVKAETNERAKEDA